MRFGSPCSTGTIFTQTFRSKPPSPDWLGGKKEFSCLYLQPEQRRALNTYACATFFLALGSSGMVPKRWSHKGELTPKPPLSPT